MCAVLALTHTTHTHTHTHTHTNTHTHAHVLIRGSKTFFLPTKAHALEPWRFTKFFIQTRFAPLLCLSYNWIAFQMQKGDMTCTRLSRRRKKNNFLPSFFYLFFFFFNYFSAINLLAPLIFLLHVFPLFRPDRT